MELLHVFREPVNAWSHCSWLLLSIPGTVWLWKRSGGNRAKQCSLLVFGLSLAFCYGSSTLNHGIRLSVEGLSVCNVIDNIGIYLLIAGSYTPVAWNLLDGRWRWSTLAATWALAALGITLQVIFRTLPRGISTGLYLALGWGASLCYFELARRLTHRPLRLVVWGGVLYTTGAVIYLCRWPRFSPGIVGPHELFHFFVMAGSLCHFAFMLRYVATPAAPVPGTRSRVLSLPLPFQVLAVPVLIPIQSYPAQNGSGRSEGPFSPRSSRA